MAWIYLIMSGAFEVVAVTGINQIVKHKNLKSYLIVLFGFIVSFSLLALAMKELPMGISYAVWTGIGTVGVTLLGMLFYREPKDWRPIVFIGMILIAVVGLKMTT
ncbi:DMT family transporter [Lederbergia ruris]|uniref:Multidrug resistance protein YkkD n=1 Tax=Lederbergia ruris TaxID=217495 RepID=A0ABQ4KPN2_9BACI|nr:multidrug efflux SMR transporter [Lederbergia ruris]GIN59901.1 multidrug resistance protein YkkD [Lederbergia ruris]